MQNEVQQERGGDTSSPLFCVVIPAYNEAARLASVIQRAATKAPVVVVDDGSVDQTAEVAEQSGATILKHKINQGKGKALDTGFQYACDHGYQAVLTMDADGQHDPDDIEKFITTFDVDTCPVVVGNRMQDVQTMPLIRKWTNRFMSALLSRKMGQTVPDTQCGYRMYACHLLPLLKSDSMRFAAESEVLLKLAQQKIPIGSVPVKTIYGTEKSKINPVVDTIRFFLMLRRY